MHSSRELLESLAKDSTPADDPKAELEKRYRPVLQAFARRVGVEANEMSAAVDTALAHLYECARAEEYDPELSGRERLYRVAKAHIAEASLSAADSLQSDEALHEAWNAEWRRALVRFSIQTLSTSTDTDHRSLQAFEMHVVEKRSASEVAKELGMSSTAVHGAKNLLLGKLQALMGELEDRF